MLCKKREYLHNYSECLVQGLPFSWGTAGTNFSAFWKGLNRRKGNMEKKKNIKLDLTPFYYWNFSLILNIKIIMWHRNGIFLSMNLNIGRTTCWAWDHESQTSNLKTIFFSVDLNKGMHTWFIQPLVWSQMIANYLHWYQTRTSTPNFRNAIFLGIFMETKCVVYVWGILIRALMEICF